MTLDSYRKNYRIRLAQKGNSNRSYEVTFPFDVIDKEARKHNLSINEFIKKYQAVAQYDGFEGVLYTFEKIQSQNNHNNKG
jgi:hypothetical protein